MTEDAKKITPRPPHSIRESEEAKARWKEMMQPYPFAWNDPTAKSILQAYCEQFMAVCQCTVAIERYGAEFFNDKGVLVVNPAISTRVTVQGAASARLKEFHARLKELAPKDGRESTKDRNVKAGAISAPKAGLLASNRLN